MKSIISPFFKSKYNYFSMVLLYIRIVPIAAAVKILFYLLNAALPTVTIFANARFLDTAVGMATGRGGWSDVALPLLLVVALLVFRHYAEDLSGLIDTRSRNRVKAAILPAVAERVACVKYRYQEDQGSLDIMGRAMGGFEDMPQRFFDHAFGGFRIAVEFMGFVMVLGMQLWWAAGLFLVTFIPSLVVSYKYGGKSYGAERELSRIERKADYLFRMLTGRDTVEERYLYGYTDRMNQEYKKDYEYVRVARKKWDRLWWGNIKVSGIWTLLSGILSVAVLVPAAAVPRADGSVRLSIGMFAAMVNAVMGLCMRMQESISDCIKDGKEKLEYLKDLNAFLAFGTEEGAISLPERHVPKIQRVEFRKVGFRYPGCGKEVLKGFDLELTAGKHYAFVGVNGAGKTTLVKLLTGLYDDYEGEILIDGKELREYSLGELKALSAVVYQDFCRYPLSLYGNIAIGNIRDMGDGQKVREAVERIGLSQAVDALPRKMETPVTKAEEGGVDLSGGEWQKVALARLLVSPAVIKILDEPTAALDPVAEGRVYEEFAKTAGQARDQGGVVIFISHRLASTKLADEIVVVADGAVAEKGDFATLMQKRGIYYEMFESQRKWYQ